MTMRLITIVSLTLMLSAYSLAETNYDKLKKDVTVMSQIIKSAFESTDCKHCRIEVDGKYLAEQGFLFMISDRHGLWFRGEDFSRYSDLLEEEDIHHLAELPGIITRVVTRGIPAAPLPPDVNFEYNYEIDEEAYDVMRDLSREMSRLGQEIRERQIELIHASDKERAEVEKAIAKLESRTDELGEKHKAMETQLNQHREEMLAKRKVQHEEQLKQIKAQQASIESGVLGAFCDYGSTLRSLPDSEHITLVFKNKHSNDGDTIMVFNKKDVTNCDTGTKLAGHALQYQF